MPRCCYCDKKVDVTEVVLSTVGTFLMCSTCKDSLPSPVTYHNLDIISLNYQQRRQKLKEKTDHLRIECCVLDSVSEDLRQANVDTFLKNNTQLNQSMEHTAKLRSELQNRVPVYVEDMSPPYMKEWGKWSRISYSEIDEDHRDYGWRGPSLLLKAAKRGAINVLQWFEHLNEFDQIIGDLVVRHDIWDLVKTGDTRIMDWFLQNKQYFLDSESLQDGLRAATSYGDLDMLDWFVAHLDYLEDSDSDLKFLKCDHDRHVWLLKRFREAAENNDVDTFQWWCEQLPNDKMAPFSYYNNPYDTAVKHGSLDVLQFIYSFHKLKDWQVKEYIDKAEKLGHSHVVEWLLSL